MTGREKYDIITSENKRKALYTLLENKLQTKQTEKMQLKFTNLLSEIANLEECENWYDVCDLQASITAYAEEYRNACTDLLIALYMEIADKKGAV